MQLKFSVREMTDSGEEITVENPTKDINDFIAVETVSLLNPKTLL